MSNFIEPEYANIGGMFADDPNYRYRMPKLEVAFAKKKTLLPNILQVAEALHSSSHESGNKTSRPEEIVKFFALELGTNGSCPALAKLCKREQHSHLAGKHDEATLQTLLAEYVETFVLCPVCLKPETEYYVRSRGGSIRLNCFGCGALEKVQQSDHPLCKYIRKQYEANNGGTKKQKKQKKNGMKDDAKAPKDKKKKKQQDDEGI